MPQEQNRNSPSDAISLSPFVDVLGIQRYETSDGLATLDVVVSDQQLRSRGIMHGGAVSSLLDTAMGVAVSTRTPSGFFAVTAQLNVHFIRPAWNGESLRVRAEVEHAGQLTAVARGTIVTTEDVVVAISTGTFIFVKSKDGEDTPLLREPDDFERRRTSTD